MIQTECVCIINMTPNQHGWWQDIHTGKYYISSPVALLPDSDNANFLQDDDSDHFVAMDNDLDNTIEYEVTKAVDGKQIQYNNMVINIQISNHMRNNLSICLLTFIH